MGYWKAPSDTLMAVQAQKAADGALLSLRIGKWLNRSIPINFDKANLPRSSARPFLRWYLKQVRDWLAYREAGPICYIAVFENKGGFHVHILMHVPFGLWDDFQAAEDRWVRFGLEKYEGVYHPDVLWDVPVINYERLIRGHASERDYLKQLRGAVRYNLKGATRMDTAAFLGMSEDDISNLNPKSLPSHQGRVWGRRVSVSHSLLSTRVSSPLHPDPGRSWLEDAEREAQAGRAFHNATIGSGRVRRRTS